MRENRQRRPEAERGSDPWEENRCLVCGRESNGKAICSDPNCAVELALG
ncbi:MAG: hypothetical protein ACOY93_13105 [Bacillota bacterium]